MQDGLGRASTLPPLRDDGAEIREASAAAQPTAGRRSRSIHPSAALVVLVTIAGLGLRLAPFWDSVYGDEVSTYWLSIEHSLGGIIRTLYGDSIDLNPPLYFVSAWISTRVFGDSAESLRLVSLLAGTAAIPLVYVLGRLTVSVAVGALAAVFVALNPFLIDYASEARPYSLLMLVLLCSSLSLVMAVRTRRRGWWGVYALCSCAAVYTSYTAVFLLAGQFLWAFVAHPRSRRPLVVANVAAALMFVPWLPAYIRDSHSRGTNAFEFWNHFDAHWVRVALERWAVGHPTLKLDVVPGRLGLWLAAAGVLLAVIGLAARWSVARRSRTAAPMDRDSVLPLVLAVSAPLGLALYSVLVKSIFDLRNEIGSSPGLALAAAWIVVAGAAGRVLRGVAGALLVAALAIGATQLPAADHRRPDYDGAVGVITRAGAPGAPIVDAFAFTPGPPTALEAALRLSDDASARTHPVVRLGTPRLVDVLRAPPYAHLPPQTPGAVAREAADGARNGRFFLVSMLPVSRAEMLWARSHPGKTFSPLDPFLRRVPDRYTISRVTKLDGSASLYVTEFSAGGS